MPARSGVGDECGGWGEARRSAERATAAMGTAMARAARPGPAHGDRTTAAKRTTTTMATMTTIAINDDDSGGSGQRQRWAVCPLRLSSLCGRGWGLQDGDHS